MFNLELNSNEQRLLLEILEIDMKSLKSEISRTEHKEFRHALFERASVLEGIIRALQSQQRLDETDYISS